MSIRTADGFASAGAAKAMKHAHTQTNIAR